MARPFNFERVGITADDDAPNDTEPAIADVFTLAVNARENRMAGSGRMADGWSYYLAFVAGTTPTATVTTWVRDAAQSAPNWVQAGQETLVAGAVLKTILGIDISDVFLQVSSIAGSPTSLEVRAAPMAGS